jgi:hypothetical protein
MTLLTSHRQVEGLRQKKNSLTSIALWRSVTRWINEAVRNANPVERALTDFDAD